MRLNETEKRGQPETKHCFSQLLQPSCHQKVLELIQASSCLGLRAGTTKIREKPIWIRLNFLALMIRRYHFSLILPSLKHHLIISTYFVTD